MAAVTITVLRWNCCLRETWLYAGTSEYPTVLERVTTRSVQIISRKDQRKLESSETIRQALALEASEDRVRATWRHVEVDRNDRPFDVNRCNKTKRNSLSGN